MAQSKSDTLYLCLFEEVKVLYLRFRKARTLFYWTFLRLSNAFVLKYSNAKGSFCFLHILSRT